MSHLYYAHKALARIVFRCSAQEQPYNKFVPHKYEEQALKHAEMRLRKGAEKACKEGWISTWDIAW